VLEKLQQQLHETYRTEPTHDVRDFLVTDPYVAKILSGDNKLAGNGETLLLCEDEDGIAVSLYLEDEMLERLSGDDPVAALRAGQLDDLCKVIEGLSHFNYVVWRASRDRSVSLLELELQAEVDKFVSTMQLAMDQQDGELVNGLHGRLFDDVQFHQNLDAEQAARYRAANEFAARFCRGLRRRLLHGDDGALPELRQFFRLSCSEKISHINSATWQPG
jgi:hypothetical protein